MAEDEAPDAAPAPAVAAAPSPPPWMSESSVGPMEESSHRRLLRAFHACLVGGRRMFVIPRLNKSAAEFYTANLGLLPRELHKRELRDAAEGEEDNSEFGDLKPHVMQDAFGRGPEWSRASSVGVLADFNLYGYDIQTPVNPTTCKIRGQKTVAVCRNVLADGDDWDLERQLAALAGFRNEIVAITESGRRGVHAVFRLRRAIPNPHRLLWRGAREAQRAKDLTANLPAFRDAASALRARLEAAGFDPDGMIVDHSVLTRLPGFRHGGTGNPCRLLYLNPRPWPVGAPDRVYLHPDLKAVWDRPVVVAVGDPPASSEPVVDPLVSSAPSVDPLAEYASSADPLVSESSASDSPAEEGLFDGIGGLWWEPAGSAGTVGSVGEGGALVQGASGRGGDVVPVNVNTSPPGSAPRRPNRRDFLADWETYLSLKAQGVPARHRRHRLHMAMFSVATIMGWSDEDLAGEWRRIVGVRPTNIGYDAGRAVSDLLGGWAARGRRESIRLPDLARLPDLDGRKLGILTESLKAGGRRHAPLAARIVAEMLIPVGRTLPSQSKKGTLGLSSRAMQERFGCRYADARGALIDAGLLEITDNNSVPGLRTMQYRIHWARLLIMCGFRSEEVVWP